MNLMHLSARSNRESILKNGLIPTPIKLITHRNHFVKHGLLNEKQNGIYTWVDGLDNEKYARDMVYCVVWLHGRNSMDPIEDECVDFSKVKEGPIFEHDQMLFDLFVAEIPDDNQGLLHGQTHGEDKYWSSYQMDERFEHNAKPMHILKNPQKVKVVDEILYTYRNGKIEISFRSGIQ